MRMSALIGCVPGVGFARGAVDDTTGQLHNIAPDQLGVGVEEVKRLLDGHTPQLPQAPGAWWTTMKDESLVSHRTSPTFSRGPPGWRRRTSSRADPGRVSVFPGLCQGDVSEHALIDACPSGARTCVLGGRP
jgi:hypothetical protein